MKVKVQSSKDRSYCCVPQCTSTGFKNPDLSFHKFPNANIPGEWGIINARRKQEWIRVLRIGKKVTARMPVCSKHFTRNDYILPGNFRKRPHLKKTAIPSLCLPVTPYDHKLKVGLKKANKEQTPYDHKLKVGLKKANKEQTPYDHKLKMDLKENQEQTPYVHKLKIDVKKGNEEQSVEESKDLSSLLAYHPALSSLSWLFGVWESVEAEVSYPTMDTLKYNEILEFQPTMQPLLDYKSDTWHPVKKTKMHCEKGFLRIDPESKGIALLVSHNFGLTEISEGSVDNESICLETKSLSRMSYSKHAVTVKLVRKWHLEEGELYSTVLMETTNQPLQTHLQCKYRRKT